MAIHHVTFHTLNGKPVFESETYDGWMRAMLPDVMRAHKIICLAWEIMPTHVHLIVEDFADLSRGTVVNLIKGGTSHAFFAAFPETRADLLGGHLWAKGYDAVRTTTHRQFLATLQYVRTNRARANL